MLTTKTSHLHDLQAVQCGISYHRASWRMGRKNNFNRVVFQFVKFLLIWWHYRNCFIEQMFLTVLWSHSPYIPSTSLTQVSFCLRSLVLSLCMNWNRVGYHSSPYKKHYAYSLLYSEEFSHELIIYFSEPGLSLRLRRVSIYQCYQPICCVHSINRTRLYSNTFAWWSVTFHEESMLTWNGGSFL
jgi:hypothetical protein